MGWLRGCSAEGAEGAHNCGAPTSGADRGKRACRPAAHDLHRIDGGKCRRIGAGIDPAIAGPVWRICIADDADQPLLRDSESTHPKSPLACDSGKAKGHAAAARPNQAQINRRRCLGNRKLRCASGMGTEQALQHSARCFLSLLRDVQTAAARRPKLSRGAPAHSRPSEQLTLEIESHHTDATHKHGTQSDSEARPLLSDAAASSDGALQAGRAASFWRCVTRDSLHRHFSARKHVWLLSTSARHSIDQSMSR